MNIISALILGYVVLLGLLFLFRKNLELLIAKSTYVLFPLVLLVVLSGLFMPQLFTQLAKQTLEANGIITTETIPSDNPSTEDKTESGTGISIIDGIQDFVTRNNPIIEGFSAAMTSLLAFVYRILTLIGGLIVLTVLVYVHYTLGESLNLANIESRLAALENNLENNSNKKKYA